MPAVGLGVWRMEGKEIRDLIINAINIGYRHFDCPGSTHLPDLRALDLEVVAQITHWAVTYVNKVMLLSADYKNEAEVGEALAGAFSTGLVKREDLFITTKGQFNFQSRLWNSGHGHVVEACKDSLKKLRLDYLDLYLVHFPVTTKHTGVGTTASALDEDGVLEIDTTISLETTWHAMEELVSFQ
ncbi:unnamed protein product [Prunus armeniaca]|uniref:NADP-dependent oxidoreductase domain-containing protein n=1 Tax=Prunus armeniaca TaxID=36596 RepID=A0A6J5WGQ7_PRUAR|nr:unnamed protein product [Prunus armeniaca]